MWCWGGDLLYFSSSPHLNRSWEKTAGSSLLLHRLLCFTCLSFPLWLCFLFVITLGRLNSQDFPLCLELEPILRCGFLLPLGPTLFSFFFSLFLSRCFPVFHIFPDYEAFRGAVGDSPKRIAGGAFLTFSHHSPKGPCQSAPSRPFPNDSYTGTPTFIPKFPHRPHAFFSCPGRDIGSGPVV